MNALLLAEALDIDMTDVVGDIAYKQYIAEERVAITLKELKRHVDILMGRYNYDR